MKPVSSLMTSWLGLEARFPWVTLLCWCIVNKFLRVYWFLGKNLSNFVPPFWKLYNPYCHIKQSPEFMIPTFQEDFWITLLNQKSQNAGTSCTFFVILLKNLTFEGGVFSYFHWQRNIKLNDPDIEAFNINKTNFSHLKVRKVQIFALN